MADVSFSNTANVTGNYDAVPVTLESEAVITEIINGLTIQKTADKQNWATGTLKYTITITNNAQNALESPKVTDNLDISLITLVDSSVQVNGTDVQYTYDSTTGLLTVDLESIAVGSSSVVTFQVQKV